MFHQQPISYFDKNFPLLIAPSGHYVNAEIQLQGCELHEYPQYAFILYFYHLNRLLAIQ